MSFRQINNGGLAGWLLCAIAVLVSRVNCMPVIQMVNRQTDVWRDKKGGLASWLLYAIIVIILIIVLIVVLRFLLNVI